MLPAVTIFILFCFLPGVKSSMSNRNFWFPIIYVASSLAVAFVFHGGAGVASNSVFDVVISVVLAIGLYWSALPRDQIRTAVLAALVIGQYFMVTVGLGTAVGGTIDAKAQRDRLDIEYVASQSGRAICWDPTLCYWAKKDFEFDFFNMNQLFILGKRGPELLLQQLQRHEFSVVILTQPIEAAGASDARPWFDGVRRVLDSEYRVARSSEGRVFFVPRNDIQIPAR
jgi:hypothetical protein